MHTDKDPLIGASEETCRAILAPLVGRIICIQLVPSSDSGTGHALRFVGVISRATAVGFEKGVCTGRVRIQFSRLWMQADSRVPCDCSQWNEVSSKMLIAMMIAMTIDGAQFENWYKPPPNDNGRTWRLYAHLQLLGAVPPDPAKCYRPPVLMSPPW